MQRRVWFISGASRGFGRLLCEAVLKRGDYAVAAAHDLKPLQELAHAYGDAVLLQKVDVTRGNQVLDAIHRGRAHFGRLCVIVAAAGYAQFGAVEEVSREEAWADIETNVLGTLSVIQAALPILRAQGFGHILPIPAPAGTAASSMRFPAARFAIAGIVEALAGEVAGFGIKVTAIDLGAGVDSSLAEYPSRCARLLPAYDEARGKFQALARPAALTDMPAAVDAIFRLVESPQPPPLRLALGSVAPLSG